MNLGVTAVSIKGLVKNNNEDMALVFSEFLRDGRVSVNSSGKEPAVIAVADGIGGSQGGEIASEEILKSLEFFCKNQVRDFSLDDLPEKLKEWAEIANRLLILRAGKLGFAGMGTTLTGLLFYSGAVFLFNAGDSRVYRYRDGILRQLTKDHSLRNLLKKPEIPRNIMYNAFGKKEDFFLDIEEISSRVMKDDIFLICSDGLCDMLSAEEISECFKEENPVDVLVRKALKAGGKDNITVVGVKIL